MGAEGSNLLMEIKGGPHPACTCADEAGEASVNDFVIVGQYEWTPRLHLQTILLARDGLSAVKLCDFKILGAEPGFVDNLKSKEKKNQSCGGMLHTFFCEAKAGLGEHAPVLQGPQTPRG